MQVVHEADDICADVSEEKVFNGAGEVMGQEAMSQDINNGQEYTILLLLNQRGVASNAEAGTRSNVLVCVEVLHLTSLV
ncbi:MAG: hypothetical protein OEU26_02855 [Candidatus Tectomicrobia bacterium]|nr:hypothetical protein [Candidatus Tectomicrobia bacterium]